MTAIACSVFFFPATAIACSVFLFFPPFNLEAYYTLDGKI